MIYSGHKFLGGPTTGIVAGRKDLVRAAYLQNRGIGRGMKVGKESIVGVMAALEAWERRDHAGIRDPASGPRSISGAPPSKAAMASRPRSSPTRPAIRLDRLQVTVRPDSGFTARQVWRRHWPQAIRPIIVRDHETERGHFYLDPCNLHPGEAEIVAQALVGTLRSSNMARFVEGEQQQLPSRHS